MMKVSNGRCVRHLGLRSMGAAKTRNIVAVLAIALTTVLFTTLFTIAFSINESYQQENFRRMGGDSHGAIKEITWEQTEDFRRDPLIVESTARLFVGMLQEPPFQKSHVEVSYIEPQGADHFFCTPEEGTLPREGTDEVATDTHVLALLGVEPEVGAKITLPITIDSDFGEGQTITRTFTLSGWWAYDSAIVANHVLLPRSAAQELADLSQAKGMSMTGKWTLDVMFKNTLNIEENLEKVLENHGYQSTDPGADNYRKLGVSWAHTGSRFSSDLDPMEVLAVAAVLLLILLTGYLIIYNVFQISVTNDIRFYGLLKTIGATGRQLKRIIRQQAMILSLVGIPLGLLIGFVVGNVLTPVVMKTTSYHRAFVTFNPWIFLGSAAFSLVTVRISCARPGRMAARVSPVEAVRYTEGSIPGRRTRKKTMSLRGGPQGPTWQSHKVSGRRMGSFAGAQDDKQTCHCEPVRTLVWQSRKVSENHMGSFAGAQDDKGGPYADAASLPRMAWANLGRSKSKTVVTVVSLTLAVVLLDLTYTFTSGFDMEKYLSGQVVTDFIVGYADQFVAGSGGFRSVDNAVPEEVIAGMDAQGGITGSGRIYAKSWGVEQFVTEDWLRESWLRMGNRDYAEQQVQYREHMPDGSVVTDALLYGMEDFPLSKLRVVEGDLEPLKDPNQNAIAAVCYADDDGNVEPGSCTVQVGDVMKLRQASEWCYYDTATGEEITLEEANARLIQEMGRVSYERRAKTYTEETYTVCALVTVPSAISFRYGFVGACDYVLGAERFQRDTGTDNVMIYVFDTTDEANGAMEDFLASYTETVFPEYDYESKQTYMAHFEDFRGMFLALGGVMSLIIGLVGVLNFINAVLTGILTRKRELAVLQAVGMTGMQLKTMLVWEGLYYTFLALALSTALSAIIPALAGDAVEKMFSFFTYRFTLVPVAWVMPVFLLLGTLVPLAVYRAVAKMTIVERLRETDG